MSKNDLSLILEDSHLLLQHPLMYFLSTNIVLWTSFMDFGLDLAKYTGHA